MTTLEVAAEPAIPGEAIIPEKPWIRAVGGEVIRYVRPGIEPNLVRDIRSCGNTKLLQRLLEDAKVELEDHLFDLPLLYDIDVPNAEVAVEDIPHFVQGMVDGWHRGLKITTDYVEGCPANEVLEATPSYVEAMLTSYTGLQRYASSCVAEGRLFLGDIFDPGQHSFREGRRRLTLYDLDPFFSEPTEDNRQQAIKNTQDSFRYVLPGCFEANA